MAKEIKASKPPKIPEVVMDCADTNEITQPCSFDQKKENLRFAYSEVIYLCRLTYWRVDIIR